jgi:hypothetical protein
MQANLEVYHARVAQAQVRTNSSGGAECVPELAWLRGLQRIARTRAEDGGVGWAAVGVRVGADCAVPGSPGALQDALLDSSGLGQDVLCMTPEQVRPTSCSACSPSASRRRYQLSPTPGQHQGDQTHQPRSTASAHAIPHNPDLELIARVRSLQPLTPPHRTPPRHPRWSWLSSSAWVPSRRRAPRWTSTTPSCPRTMCWPRRSAPPPRRCSPPRRCRRQAAATARAAARRRARVVATAAKAVKVACAAVPSLRGAAVAWRVVVC